MVKVKWFGKMVLNILDNGKKENNMVKEHIPIQMENKLKELGVKEKNNE